MRYKVERDGVDHINAYSQGRTELGLLLSNFAHTPIDTEDGHFESVEGYWYWLLVSPTMPGRDDLRSMYGFKAKARGRELRAAEYPRMDFMEFRRKICAAIDDKIEGTPRLKQLLRENELPIVHYYVYNSRVKFPDEGGWIWDHYETRADELRSKGARKEVTVMTREPKGTYRFCLSCREQEGDCHCSFVGKEPKWEIRDRQTHQPLDTVLIDTDSPT